MTRKFFLSAMALLSLSLLLSFSYKAADFNGTWTLDESASELGQFGTRAASSKIVIEQSAESFKMIRSNTGFDGTNADITENYLIGKESENTGLMNSKKTGKLAWDGEQAFKIDFALKMEFQGQSFELTGNEKWELAADGKSMTLFTRLTTPQGDMETKAVYKKK